MASIWVREFTGGLDVRRLPETSKGGTLLKGIDGHINRGGEFEQRAAFVKIMTLPQGATTGLAFTPSGLTVFGSGPAPALPAGVAYQRLQHADGATALVKVPSYDLFSSRIYAVGVFADGQLFHYYDGVRVTNFGSNTQVKPGPFVRTFGQKMNTASGSSLIFSGIANPTNYNDAVGAGFFDLSQEDYGSEQLTAIGKYQNYLAIFSDRTVQIRYMDPDPALSKAIQSLDNTGTISPRSVTKFGDNDLFYLDASGVRSIRARDSSNAATTTDVGSAVDGLISALITSLPVNEVEDAIGLIEPRDGRYWLIVKDQIFVFSYFPAAKVSAWTTYSPGFEIDDAIVYKRRVYLRSGDDIYVYGGLGNAFAYDDTSAVAWLPYLDAEAPTKAKTLNGIDLACRGAWEVHMGMEPKEIDVSDKIGTVIDTTYTDQRIPAEHRSTHFSVRVASQGARDDGGPAILGSIIIHYTAETDEAKA